MFCFFFWNQINQSCNVNGQSLLTNRPSLPSVHSPSLQLAQKKRNAEPVHLAESDEELSSLRKTNELNEL